MTLIANELEFVFLTTVAWSDRGVSKLYAENTNVPSKSCQCWVRFLHRQGTWNDCGRPGCFFLREHFAFARRGRPIMTPRGTPNYGGSGGVGQHFPADRWSMSGSSGSSAPTDACNPAFLQAGLFGIHVRCRVLILYVTGMTWRKCPQSRFARYVRAPYPPALKVTKLR